MSREPMLTAVEQCGRCCPSPAASGSAAGQGRITVAGQQCGTLLQLAQQHLGGQVAALQGPAALDDIGRLQGTKELLEAGGQDNLY